MTVRDWSRPKDEAMTTESDEGWCVSRPCFLECARQVASGGVLNQPPDQGPGKARSNPNSDTPVSSACAIVDTALDCENVWVNPNHAWQNIGSEGVALDRTVAWRHRSALVERWIRPAGTDIS